MSYTLNRWTQRGKLAGTLTIADDGGMAPGGDEVIAGYVAARMARALCSAEEAARWVDGRSDGYTEITSRASPPDWPARPPPQAAAFREWQHPRDDFGRFIHDPGLSVLAGKDSLAAHTGPDGKLDPQRQALHEAILGRIIGGHKRQAHPRALFLGGGPASGKTTVMRDPPPDAAQIACDDIKSDLPEYPEMVAAHDVMAGEYVQEESKHLKEQALLRAGDAQVNVLLDSTGDTSYNLMASEIAELRRRGYLVEGKYVTVDADEAVRRSMARARSSGRMVPEATIRAMHASVTRIFAQLVAHDDYDAAELWDNNVPQGAEARLVGRKLPGGRWEVLDRALWERFLAKAGGDGSGRRRGSHRAGAGGDPGRRVPARRAGHAGEPGAVRPGAGRGGRDAGEGDHAGHPRLSAAFDPHQPRDRKGRWTSHEAGMGLASARVASAGEFAAAFSRAFRGSPYAAFVNHYSPAEIRAARMTPILAEGGRGGVLIHDHGDGRIEATALFNAGGSPALGFLLLKHAIAEYRVNYVECFGPALPKLYGKLGFVDSDTFPFDPAQEPEGWDHARFDEPDYHLMTLGTAVAAAVIDGIDLDAVRAEAERVDPQWWAQYGEEAWRATLVLAGLASPSGQD